MSSSEGSPDARAGSACGDAEIRVVSRDISFFADGFRGFLTGAAPRPLWGLPVVFVATGALGAAGGSLLVSILFVFLGTVNTV